MANLFAIALAENRHVYQPGETISGVLLLNTDKELTLRGVRVELHGLGHVRIRSGKVTYERRNTYLSYQAILLGRGKNLCFTCVFGYVRLNRYSEIHQYQFFEYESRGIRITRGERGEEGTRDFSKF